MFFEGSEKKLDVMVSQGAVNFRQLPRSFWANLVACAKAEILSEICNADCDAYLLSESSLFVWDSRVLILTCGNSTLISAAISLLNFIGVDNLQRLSYQRKNEFFAHLQQSAFQEDVTLLRQIIPGRAYRIGHLDTHHHYSFDYVSEELTVSRPSTTSLQMYHINAAVAQYLRSEALSINGVRQLLMFDTLFVDFKYDDHLFSPAGYSINGISGDKYFTIHVTPNELSSYVSFETNIELNQYPVAILPRLLHILQPRSWDMVACKEMPIMVDLSGYTRIASGAIPFEQGYNTQFSYYQQTHHESLIPETL